LVNKIEIAITAIPPIIEIKAIELLSNLPCKKVTPPYINAIPPIKTPTILLNCLIRSLKNT